MKTQEIIQKEIQQVVDGKPEISVKDAQVALIVKLGRFVDGKEVVSAFKTLQQSGMGRVMIGRRGKHTRFVTQASQVETKARLTADEISKLREVLRAWDLTEKK